MLNFKELHPESEEAWLELRTKVLTASDIGVLFGFNKWKSVSALIKSKQEFEPFENAYTWLGLVLEPVVVEVVNKVLDTDFKLFENGSRSFFVDMDIRLGATPDAGDEGAILLECKTTKPHNALKWAEWPPAYYLTQLYTQMIATGRQTGYLGVMSTNLTQKTPKLNLPITIHELKRSPEFDAILLNIVKEFWIASDNDKVYRVNRKVQHILELQLRFLTRKIHG